jgi:hypothetical protein
LSVFQNPCFFLFHRAGFIAGWPEIGPVFFFLKDTKRKAFEARYQGAARMRCRNIDTAAPL